MTQVTIKKEIVQNSIDIDSLVLETPKTMIREKPKNNQKKKEVKKKKKNQ